MDQTSALVDQLQKCLPCWKARLDAQNKLRMASNGDLDCWVAAREAVDSKTATYIRNVAFATSARLACSDYLLKKPEAPNTQRDQGEGSELLTEVVEGFRGLVVKRLAAIQKQLDLPLCRACTDIEQEEVEGGGKREWFEVIGSKAFAPTCHIQFPSVSLALYTNADLLRAVLDPDTFRVHPPGATPSSALQKQGFLHGEEEHGMGGMDGVSRMLKCVVAPGHEDLQLKLQDLRPELRQVGLDDSLHAWYARQQAAAAAATAEERYIPSCQRLCRRGVPASSRAKAWEGALGLRPLTDTHQDHFNQLCHEVASTQLLTDVLVAADLQQVSDSEHFFLFEEVIRAVLLAFSRDAEIAELCSHQPFLRVGGKAAGSSARMLYPPSGILPYQGMVLLAAPLCYLHKHPAAVYRMFRSMYCRHWCWLHSLTADPRGLLCLCRTFLEMLQREDPEVCAHLQHLHYSPLRIAVPWLTAAFVGYLPPAEVLLLWDRVVGFDSLMPLAAMAAAVICFRRELILCSQTSSELLTAVGDLSQLKTVPLLQAILFAS